MELNSHSEIAVFAALARENTALNWYVIADSAQNNLLPDALIKPGCLARCLFGASQHSPIAEYAPHLIELESPLEDGQAWKRISLMAKAHPCISVIASEENFETLCRHLTGCIEVALPDGQEIFFAFWDAAILGTLFGQRDDSTLHVKGPVLTMEQRTSLVGGMTQWWYWDRAKILHQIICDKSGERPAALPLKLEQQQVDDLVEASVPDHVLYYLELNQPFLIDKIPLAHRYEFVRQSLVVARDIGLAQMGEIVNFLCVQLIYGERMRESYICSLLDKVKNRESEFGEIIHQLP
jgi:hypothetical protein